MFPEGRIFINYMQLRKAVEEFFKHWNLLSKSTGKSIRCSFSHTPGAKKKPEDVTEGVMKINLKRGRQLLLLLTDLSM